MVGRQTLDLLVEVRVLLSQPFLYTSFATIMLITEFFLTLNFRNSKILKRFSRWVTFS